MTLRRTPPSVTQPLAAELAPPAPSPAATSLRVGDLVIALDARAGARVEMAVGDDATLRFIFPAESALRWVDAATKLSAVRISVTRGDEAVYRTPALIAEGAGALSCSRTITALESRYHLHLQRATDAQDALALPIGEELMHSLLHAIHNIAARAQALSERAS